MKADLTQSILAGTHSTVSLVSLPNIFKDAALRFSPTPEDSEPQSINHLHIYIIHYKCIIVQCKL